MLLAVALTLVAEAVPEAFAWVPEGVRSASNCCRSLARVLLSDVVPVVLVVPAVLALSESLAELPASDAPDISPDGRLIAYHSAASDLVPGDTNGVPDVFVYDRLTGTTTLLSSSRLGPWSASNRSMDPFFSADGKVLFFESAASDLLGQDFNDQLDIFAYNIISSGGIPVFQVVLARDRRGVALTWPVPPGTACQVQFKNSLADPEWQDLTTGVTVIGNQGYLSDSGSGPQRFYRVIARPIFAVR